MANSMTTTLKQSRLLMSLNEGKVHRPGSSRMARWMALTQNDFCDNVHMLLKVDGKIMAVAIYDYAAFMMKVMTISTLTERLV